MTEGELVPDIGGGYVKYPPHYICGIISKPKVDRTAPFNFTYAELGRGANVVYDILTRLSIHKDTWAQVIENQWKLRY